MIIHSDVLSYRDFDQAGFLSGAELIEFDMKGSRSRKRAFKFSLLGSSPYQRGFGASKNGEKAASWDEWGIFLAHLFKVDPNAHCGKYNYQSEEHFHWMTGDRFRTLVPNDQHKRHKWGMGMPSCTYSYSVAYCDCGAERRWLLNTNWEEFSERV